MTRDVEMVRYVTHGRFWTDAQIDDFLERQTRHLARHGVCFCAAEAKTDGEVVGLVGLQPLDDGTFEIGWWIWKEYWGQGFATEAARAFVDHARHVMNLPVLVAVIDPPNKASVAVAEKLGLTFDCIRPASETSARRDDSPVAIYRMEL